MQNRWLKKLSDSHIISSRNYNIRRDRWILLASHILTLYHGYSHCLSKTNKLQFMVFSIMNKEREKVQHATNSKCPCCDLTAGGWLDTVFCLFLLHCIHLYYSFLVDCWLLTGHCLLSFLIALYSSVLQLLGWLLVVYWTLSPFFS